MLEGCCALEISGCSAGCLFHPAFDGLEDAEHRPAAGGLLAGGLLQRLLTPLARRGAVGHNFRRCGDPLKPHGLKKSAQHIPVPMAHSQLVEIRLLLVNMFRMFGGRRAQPTRILRQDARRLGRSVGIICRLSEVAAQQALTLQVVF